MNEEQRLILKMLEEGKITAAEAEALLNALGQQDPLQEEERSTDMWEKVEKLGEDFADRLEAAAERFSRSVEGKVEYRLADKLSRLSKMISRFPFVSPEDVYEFSEEVEGTFRQDGDILCKLKTANGRIRVRGWTEPGFRLTVLQRVRAKDRDAALARMHRVDLPTNEALGELVIEVPSLPDVTVSLLLDVPRTLIYQLDLQTYNGSIGIADVYSRAANLYTTNGSISAVDVQAEKVHCETVNGSCRVERVVTEMFSGHTGNGTLSLRQIQAADLKCRTSNGSIRVEPQVRGTSNYELVTTNGSIRVELSDDAAKTDFDLQTSVGRISVPEGVYELKRMERQSGGWHVEGESHGLEGAANVLHLRARTGSGSIRLEKSGGVQD